MNDWKAAWFLAKHELVKDRWKSLFSLVFIAYILLFSVPSFEQSLRGDRDVMTSWATDFIYILILPLLGFVMNQSMFNYWKYNSYTKKMAQWRTMPISAKQIAIGRLIQMTIILFTAQLIFFSSQYILVSAMGSKILLLDFGLYALLWFGYSLMVAVSYIYWEIGYSGKMYFMVSMLYCAVILILTIGLGALKFGNLVFNSLEYIQQGHWWISIVGLVIGIAALLVGVKQLEKRLDKRSYTV